ncbi:MAG: ATP-binding cassette domain-containing protein [Candidatus Omnitrophica bacterium]|nr:ATP-binding cassette domain-containing protein [Candidatus Omnitrophota bacterium]
MDKAVSIKGLRYTYGPSGGAKQALKGIDLEVGKGHIFGFIGPNGAGKTTTIKILLGIMRSQEGSAELLGRPVGDVKVRSRIGYMPEVANYYGFLTARETLMMYGSVFGIGKRVLRERSAELLEKTGLSGEAERRIKYFSKGMMQKLSFAQALINDPDLLVLDEPTSGLDPLARSAMRKVLKSLQSEGKTVFFSSHELSEVELVSDRVGIIYEGGILGEGPVGELIGGKEAGQSLENYFLQMIGEGT